MKSTTFCLTFLLFLSFNFAFSQAFVTTWKTDNPGTSADNEITIPTSGSGYDYFVDWGDGNVTANVTGTITHQYLIAGTYEVNIGGSFPRIFFNNTGDREKLISVENWGNNEWASMEGAFYGCTNMQVNASDAPNLAGVTSLKEMFRSCRVLNFDLNNWNVTTIQNLSGMFDVALLFNGNIDNWNVENVEDMSRMFSNALSFNRDIGGWNVGKVENFDGTFENCGQFNQDIGNWNVSSSTTMARMFINNGMFDQNLGGWNVSDVVNMTDMLTGVTLSTVNYDNTLIGWGGLPSLQNNVLFNAGSGNYCLSSSARNILINTFNWSITDAGLDCAPLEFVTIWKTDNPGTSNDDVITIPTFDTGYNYSIDWGDGQMNFEVAGNISHKYDIPGTYTVRILGDFPRIYFNNSGDKDKIISIVQWGKGSWQNMSKAFYGCSNLEGNATDVPNLSNVTDLSYMFAESASFNQDISNWDLSNVTDISHMFNGASSFDRPIG
jgi:surface protein